MTFITTGHLVRQLRNENKLTMNELAQKLDVSQPTISRIENGLIELTLSQFQKMCDVFEITPSQFFILLDKQVETNLDEYINEKSDLNDELHKMIDDLTIEQKKGLYVLLQPYRK